MTHKVTRNDIKFTFTKDCNKHVDLPTLSTTPAPNIGTVSPFRSTRQRVKSNQPPRRRGKSSRQLQLPTGRTRSRSHFGATS